MKNGVAMGCSQSNAAGAGSSSARGANSSEAIDKQLREAGAAEALHFKVKWRFFHTLHELPDGDRLRYSPCVHDVEDQHRLQPTSLLC